MKNLIFKDPSNLEGFSIKAISKMSIMLLCCSLLFTIPCFGQLQDSLNYIFYYENGTAQQPNLAKDAYIINSDGDILHKWEGAATGITSPEGSPGYLLPDGNLLRGVKAPSANNMDFAVGLWGKIQIVDWDNNVIWEYDGCSDGTSCLHHDMEPMPNGNILVAAYVSYTTQEGASFGWEATGQTKLLIDKIYEIQPNMDDGSAEIVWEWFIADHTIQDVDPNLPNYGVVADNPGKLDINYYNSNEPFINVLVGDHTHINSISYNEQRDEIIISSFTYNEIYVIDHSTTTDEAAGSTGGNSGKGGDILYRWGNPEAYDYGGGDPDTYSSWWWTDRQHDARWLMDGSGNITIHNNHSTTKPKPSGQQNAWSEFFEIEVPYDNQGNYLYTPGQPFGPSTPIIHAEYNPQNPLFNGAFASGGQKLPNGHIFTGSASKFTMVEHDENGEIVWFFDLAEIHPPGGQVYKPQKYPIDYSGFDQLNTTVSLGEIEVVKPEMVSAIGNEITVDSEGPHTLKVFDLSGRFVAARQGNGRVTYTLSEELAPSIYVVLLRSSTGQTIVQKIFAGF